MSSPKVLLVGWDAADWKVIQPLMAAGKMPNVQRLVSSGASGQISTIHPPLSPMLWTSIATGKRPFKHGIHGFVEPAPDGSGVRPVTNLSRKSKALWNILNQNDRRCVVVGWWPSHPAEPINGVMVSDLYHRAGGPLHDGWALPDFTVHPPELAKTLADIRVHPDVLEPSLVERFIPLAREIDQDRDFRLAACLRTLAECLSIQSAAIWLLENREWDLFAVYYEALDHFCHSFMRYHPPRQEWVAERDFELYHNVVSMAYQFHDEMLGTLLEKAGEEATVVLLSDHGFHPDHLRPSSIPDIPAGPAIEHRDFGILAVSGPGIRKNESLHGASILDITPTVLTMYGLPLGEDMDGKVLAQVFVESPRLSFLPSWDQVEGRDGQHPPHTRLEPVAAHAAMEQMIALGYIERPPADRESAGRQAIRDLRFNLGESYQDAGRHHEAYEIFAELYRLDPDEQRFAVRLFASCQALGLHDEMRRIVEGLEHRRNVPFEEGRLPGPEDERQEVPHRRKPARFEPALIDYLKAQILVADKRYADALCALERVPATDMARPASFLERADLYLRLGRRNEAKREYEKALALDPDNVQASLGLCRIALRRREFRVSAQTALDALQRSDQDPMPHFLLGCALAGMHQYDGAAHAFRAAIALNPNFPAAHSRLALLLVKRLGDPDSAREHRQLARIMRSRRTSNPIRVPAAIEPVAADFFPAAPDAGLELPPISECLTVVTGLPRSGTSMVMQMLAASGASTLSDHLREADEDNPRGYLEFAPVRSLLADSKWLLGAQGKAVKIVIPLLPGLPPKVACRVILCERNLDEVLDSQDAMLRRRHEPPADAARRRMLKDEYQRSLANAKAILAQRPATSLLVIEYRAAVSEPRAVSQRINTFLGGGLNVTAMAAAVDPALHRNRAQPGGR